MDGSRRSWNLYLGESYVANGMKCLGLILSKGNSFERTATQHG